MTTVALLGYGRFGAALGSLFRDAGVAVRALDPVADVPAQLGAASLADLAAGADVVLVAVPVPGLRDALAALAPHLGPETVVADVGSVKVGPARVMTEALGAAHPWVATHPLFGPASLARGERPLRVVVCPNPLHPAAVRRVAALYERIGCEVVEEAPEEHDRVMAYTHALAFFVSKGMLDAGVPLDAPFTPPSFQAIARTIETVRADAGHLFAALHRENPFAPEARRRLLDALSGIDRRLALPPEDEGEPAPASLAIPDLGAHAPELRETRELIDEVDQAILDLLARRAQLARRAGRVKAELGQRVYDPAREARLLEERRRAAEARGLDPAGIDDIFQAILRFSRRIQDPSA